VRPARSGRVEAEEGAVARRAAVLVAAADEVDLAGAHEAETQIWQSKENID
jgi:hypothetical protein